MRNKTIDGMKAIAIIAVVLYHMGILKFGFLGVDIFLVIAGYFATRSLMKEDAKITSFILNRLKRLFPAVLIAGIICLVIGYIGMLPDDFENVSEQVIASNVLSENILSAVTTKNYWDVVNDYKPLMHMWYVGVLFEFYLLYPFIYKGFSKLKLTGGGGISCITILSLLIYLLPITTDSNKFYFLPFRFFEFGVGALICVWNFKRENKLVFYGSTAVLLALMVLNPLSIPAQIRLLATVILTGVMIITKPGSEVIVGNDVFATIGTRSFSIFVWHQVFLAFYRYYYSSKITVLFSILFILTITVISELSYRLIEKKLGMISFKSTAVFCSLLFLISCGASALVFLNAGVVRDVPELDVYTNNVHRGMHAEYCDRVYKYDHEFADNGNPKVLVVGDSFARDWGNILIESGLPLDMTYSFNISEDLIPRIKAADFVFYRQLYETLPDYAFDTNAKVYGIGTKNFGESNGIIYKNRGSEDYFEQTIEVEPTIMDEYREQLQKWGADRFVDMIAPVEVSDGVVRVFSDDHKFISQDCRHLTKGGAKYYSRLFDLRGMFGIE